jgi:hypothetical protein
MIFGRLTSKDLSAYSSNAAMDTDITNGVLSLKIEMVFMYGSPTFSEYSFGGYEVVPNEYGDCTLTEDNSYLLGVFSTTASYQTWRTIWSPNYALTTADTFNPAFEIPTATTAPSCTNSHYNDPDLYSFFGRYHDPPYKT